MPIGLIPLDERPVNTRYPRMIADIAGEMVMIPPVEMLSVYRTPANSVPLVEWLHNAAARLDTLIVSVEMLGFGGLIASRTTGDSTHQVIERLEVLRQIKSTHPNLSIYAFDLITRIANANYNIEEPLYWDEYGTRFYRFSQLYDRAKQGQDVQAELDRLRRQIPTDHMRDFIKRRMRNHAVNLNVLELLTENIFDLLVLSSDDTSHYGLGTREKRWLVEWIDRYGGDSRLMMYPGADEVGCVLLARALNQKHGKAPRFAVHYALPEDRDRIAPYEDVPVSTTIERQIRAVGGEVVEEVNDADFVVAVNPPSPINREFDPRLADGERHARTTALRTMTTQIQDWLAAEKPVIVVDVAYPNGSDPVLVDLLRQHISLGQLAAYGAWNTAGNTIGTALAQGVAAVGSQNDTARREAQERFLVHRFLEDWGYQHLAREEVRNWLENTTGMRDCTVINIDITKMMIEEKLQARLMELPGFRERWQIKPGSVRLPWNRTFEVDFNLERRS